MPEPEDYTPDDLPASDESRSGHQIVDLSDDHRTFIVFLVPESEETQQ